MKRFKNKSYQEHFSFLGKLDLLGSDITVKRLDETILAQSYKNSRHDGSMGSDESNVKIWFVLNDGGIIEDPVAIGDEYSSNYAHSQKWDDDGETLAEAIDKLLDNRNLKFVVVNEFGYSNWQERYNWNNTTIFKTPKGESISDIINKFKKDEEQKVTREISF